MDYQEWNDLIAKHFFNESKAGREVLLYVNEQLINELGATKEVGLQDFIEAVKKGPSWATHSGFCQRALQALKNWRKRDLEYPPYVAYLALFVLAAGTESDFATHAYYPRFWQLLGESVDSGTPPSFDKMIELWDDLEKWSREDKHEELGRFVARIRGGLWKVGLPLSQTLISEDERKHLTNLFDRAGLDPTDVPSPDVMPGILKCFGQDVLKKRTLRLLDIKKKDDIVLADALIELILGELEEWDGTTLEESDVKGQPSLRIQKTGLRICLNIDPVSQNVSSYLRFKTGKIFPEGGLNFVQSGDAHVWSCTEAHHGWSKVLKDYQMTPPQTLDASKINWKKGLQLTDSENNWRTYIRGATTRLFFQGQYEGLPDWVETHRLERWAQFLIVCEGDDIEKVKLWGTDSCEKFEQKNVRGLPNNWVLFSGRSATKSCLGIDILAVSTSTRLLLRGGIKTGRGNSFLKFAPPKIVLENSSGDEFVTMNRIRLKQLDKKIPVWQLPEDAPVREPLRIEVELKDRRLSRVLRLEEPNLPRTFDEVPCRNRNGRICKRDPSVSYACGATVVSIGEDIKIPYPPYPQRLPTYLSSRIEFIGERPGEIVDWPCEALPSEWHPVWAIVNKSRKKWEVYFCGSPEHLNLDHCPGEPLKERRNLKRWRRALWIRRKITKQPELGRLKVIWEKYMRVANHV